MNIHPHLEGRQQQQQQQQRRRRREQQQVQHMTLTTPPERDEVTMEKDASPFHFSSSPSFSNNTTAASSSTMSSTAVVKSRRGEMGTLSKNAKRVAVKGTNAAFEDMEGRKASFEDVSKAAQMISAAILANDTNDFVQNFLKNYKLNSRSLCMIIKAIKIINNSYEVCKKVLGEEDVFYIDSRGGGGGRRRRGGGGCEEDKEGGGEEEEEDDEKTTVVPNAVVVPCDVVRPMEMDHQCQNRDEEDRKRDEEKIAALKAEILLRNEKCFKDVIKTPQGAQVSEKFFMLMKNEVRGKGIMQPQRRGRVGDYYRGRGRATAVNSFQAPVISPFVNTRGKLINRSGRIQRNAARTACEKMQEIRHFNLIPGLDSAYSPASCDDDNDSNYEPSEFGDDYGLDSESENSLRF